MSPKPRKLKVKSSLQLTRKELGDIHAGLETAYYDTYGNARQAVLRMAGIVAEAAGIDPFVPEED